MAMIASWFSSRYEISGSIASEKDVLKLAEESRLLLAIDVRRSAAERTAY
jgi:hypothetical protein